MIEIFCYNDLAFDNMLRSVFLFYLPLHSGIRQQHTVLFGSDQGSMRLFLERNADQTPLVAH